MPSGHTEPEASACSDLMLSIVLMLTSPAFKLGGRLAANRTRRYRPPRHPRPNVKGTEARLTMHKRQFTQVLLSSGRIARS